MSLRAMYSGSASADGPRLERRRSPGTQRLQECGSGLERGGNTGARPGEPHRPDPRSARGHRRDVQVLERHERPPEADVHDVLCTPGRALDGHGRVTGKGLQHPEAVAHLRSAADPRHDHVVVPEERGIPAQQGVARVGPRRQCPRLAGRQELNDLERNEADELDVVDDTAHPEVPEHLPVLHRERMVVVVVGDHLGHHLAPLGRRGKTDTRSTCLAPCRRLPREARVEVLRRVRHIVTTAFCQLDVDPVVVESAYPPPMPSPATISRRSHRLRDRRRTSPTRCSPHPATA